MLILKISPICDVGKPPKLPASAENYISPAHGSAKDERAAGMFLLNRALAEIGIFDYEIATEPSGKPVLVGTKLFFSVSHSGGCCAVALSDSPVGVDLQELDAARRIGDLHRFARRFFAEDEYTLFESNPTASRLCEIWTRKEALCKLLGRRLDTSLSALSSLSFEGVLFETRPLVTDKEFILTTVVKNN